MKILAIDASAKSASAAICEIGDSEERLLSSFYANYKLTHSQTLLPMVDRVLDAAGISLRDIELLALTNGPGSFTGIRIGIATALGLSYGRNLPVEGVSTLETIGLSGRSYGDCIICAVMDARQKQVYNALFEYSGDALVRLTPDRAVSLDELEAELALYDRQILFAGDGAALAYAYSSHPRKIVACEPLTHQNAYFAAVLAYQKLYSRADGSPVPLRPVYLRMAQADRSKGPQ